MIEARSLTSRLARTVPTRPTTSCGCIRSYTQPGVCLYVTCLFIGHICLFIRHSACLLGRYVISSHRLGCGTMIPYSPRWLTTSTNTQSLLPRNDSLLHSHDNHAYTVPVEYTQVGIHHHYYDVTYCSLYILTPLLLCSCSVLPGQPARFFTVTKGGGVDRRGYTSGMHQPTDYYKNLTLFLLQ